MGGMNGKAAKDKGSRAEREVAAILHELTGAVVRRTLAGHSDDIGDLHGLADTTLQVKSYADTGRALREGVTELCDQQARAGTPFAACFIRRPGGRYVVAMTPEQFVHLWREATA